MRAELLRPGSPVGPNASATDRVIGLLGLLLSFKLDNPRLIAARELSGSNLLQAPHYQWVHKFFRDLIEHAGQPSNSANYTAHLLPGGLRAEIINELLTSGMSREQILHELTASGRAIIG